MKLNRNQYTIRKKSTLSNGEIEELYVLKDFPVFIGSCDNQSLDSSNDYKHDMIFDICKETGIIQLRELVDLNIIYPKYHSEAIGNWWIKHHNEFSKTILKYQNNVEVLEIGGSDSKLATKIFELQNNFKNWTILEPTIKNKIENNPKIHYIEGFYNKEFFNNHKNCYNMVIHSHVLEHMYDPINFLQLIHSMLDVDDYHIFSVPNLYLFLSNKFINALNFEHTLFLTEYIIDNLLINIGFKIIEKITYTKDSIFYVTKKTKPKKIILENKYEEYKKLYLDLIEYYKNFVESANEKLKNTKKDVYIFGGHIFTQFLIVMGLDISKIKFILDNSKIKNETRLYGSNLFIKFPEEVGLDENSLVIVKVAQYRDEILSQLLSINKNIEIYE